MSSQPGRRPMPVRGASAGRPASRSRPSRKSSERANAPALARQSARPCGPDLAARPGRPGDCWSRLPAAAGSGHCESPGGPNRVNDRGRGPRRTGLAARQHGRRAGPPPGRRARKSWRGRCTCTLLGGEGFRQRVPNRYWYATARGGWRHVGRGVAGSSLGQASVQLLVASWDGTSQIYDVTAQAGVPSS